MQRRKPHNRLPVLLPAKAVCLAAMAALVCCGALLACKPEGRRAGNVVPRIPDNADDFDEKAAAFQWPGEPSHVVALEIAGMGTIRLGLYDQVAPKSVAHVVDCVARGVYDDTLFHRVIKDFMVQGGDPATRERGPDATRIGWGDLSVEDEFQPIHHTRGTVALANRGRPGSAQSQFFIVHQDSHHLDGRYAAFGRVLSGMDVVDAIANVETDIHGRWGEKNKPLENIILDRALLERGALTNDKTAPTPSGESESA